MSTEPKETSMTDQIPAGLTRDQAQAVREWAERSYAAKVQDETMYHAARVLLAVLPKRPTLADMTPGERRACQWMQADTKRGRAIIITAEWIDGHAELIDRQGDVFCEAHTDVTPRPDLPRMEWPGGDQEAEDANTVKVGDVIESADDPRVAALPDGTILVDRDDDAVIKWGGEWSGAGYIPNESRGSQFGPWKVINIDQEADQ